MLPPGWENLPGEQQLGQGPWAGLQPDSGLSGRVRVACLAWNSLPGLVQLSCPVVWVSWSACWGNDIPCWCPGGDSRLAPAALRSGRIRAVFVNPTLCLEHSFQHCRRGQEGLAPLSEGLRLGPHVFPDTGVLDPALLARFWVVLCHQELSGCTVQGGTAGTGGSSVLSTTLHSQKSCFTSSEVTSGLQVLGNEGLGLNSASLVGDTACPGVTLAGSRLCRTITNIP